MSIEHLKVEIHRTGLAKARARRRGRPSFFRLQKAHRALKKQLKDMEAAANG